MPAPQLWLTVFEDGHPQWPPTLSTASWRVELAAAQTLQGCTLPMPHRASPIFPASPDVEQPNLQVGVHYIYLFCFRSAFAVLARIIETAPPCTRTGLFFTLGIASIVWISDDPNLLDKVGGFADATPWATEVWRVENSAISAVTIKVSDAEVRADDGPLVGSYESLPLAQRMTVDEFVSTIGLILPKVAAHMPDELETFHQIIAQASELVSEMSYACHPIGLPPATLAEYQQHEFESDRSLVDMILGQATDRLVQINTALSYLSTQGLSGAVPTLERRSLIRRYSLLGVGTAVLALTRIARSIELAFAEGALESILSNHADTAAPLPGLERLPNYDTRDWKVNSVNRWQGKTAPRTPYPKIPYFSTVLGYRESEYTISAAAQALATGGSPTWSLLTLTHEMVHGHVRSILSVILQGNPDHPRARIWAGFHQRYTDLVANRSGSSNSLLDSLRAILFTYCCMTQSHGSLTHEREHRGGELEEVKLKFSIPAEAEGLRRILEAEFRNINEILVHVLDLHYFYNSNLSAYIPLIWRSWSIMPQVRGDLRQYLLRTLLVAASKLPGTPYERFRQGRLLLLEKLTPLKDLQFAGAATVQAAVDHLVNGNWERLFYPFMASLILVDLAHHVLTSTAIRGKLNGGDRHLSITTDHSTSEQWFYYSLPDGFVDQEVAAPTAYVADRLAKKVMHLDDSVNLERETVMMFLACCSHSLKGTAP